MIRPSFKTLLALGTALGGLAAGSAWAQSIRLPAEADGTTVARSRVGLDARIDRNGNQLDVQLRARATVIDWQGFNVPERATVDFRSLLPGDAAVLNRDVSGNRSDIRGNITSGDNVAVWIMNPNGILVGGRASFSTGSLVLTTLDVDQNDFLADGRSFRLSAPADRTAGIDIANGARIRTADGPRGLVMVAPRIDASGTFDARDGDVAFVTASDVTLSYQPGSPLSVTLNRGTAVPGASQLVRGTVAGGDALFALASQGTVTDALLQVDADVTTALAGTRGIVLSAGRPASTVPGVGVSSIVGAADGVGSLTVSGALTTTDTDGGSDILAGAGGAATFTDALTTDRGVTIASGGLLTVAGAVTARSGDYRLSGAGVILGRATNAPTPVPVLQQAGDEVIISSTDGDIAGRAGLTLRSGTRGPADMLLTTTGTAAGAIAFAPGTLLTAGDRTGTLTVALRDAGNTLTLGDVRAGALRGAAGIAPAGDRLVMGTSLSLGDVDVARTLDVSAAGLTAGELVSDRAVTLDVAGALSARSIRARGGSITLSGTGDTAVGTLGTVRPGTDISVLRAGVLSLAEIDAARNVTIDAGAGSAAVTGDVAAGNNYSVSADTVTLGGTAAVRQAAGDDVRVTAGTGGIAGLAGLTLVSDADGSGDGILALTVDAARPGAALGGIAFAPRSLIAGGLAGTTDVLLRLADVNGAVQLGDVTARELLSADGIADFTTGITRAGALRVGNMAIGEDLVLGGASVAAGDLVSTRGLVRVTGTAGGVTTDDLRAAGNVIVAAAGDISVGPVEAGGGLQADAAAALLLRADATAGRDLRLAGGSVALGGRSYEAGRSIDVRARIGGIRSSRAVSLTSSSKDAGDSVRFQAAGPDGIVLASGSAIAAGANRALRVGVFNAIAEAPLALGDVSARSLGALATADANAARAPVAITATGDLRFEQLNLVDSFAAESIAGDLTVRSISVTGANAGLSLKAADRLRVQQDVSASGDVTLASGVGLTLGTVESREGRASVTSTGAVTLDTLAGASAAILTGRAITASEVRGGAVIVTANGGSAALDQVSGADVTVSATGLASLGGLRAGGDAQVTGREVTLAGTQDADGRFAATTTGGALRGAAGLAITSDADAARGGTLVLGAVGGPVLLDATSLLSGGRDGQGSVTVTADGGRIELGEVRAASLAVAGGTGADAVLRTGRLVLARNLSLIATNGIETGSVEARDIVIDGGGGDVVTGAVTGDAVTLRGAGVRFGAADVASLTATALTGDVAGQDVVASGAVSLNAAKGTATLGQVAAGGLDVVAGKAVVLGALDLNDAATLSGGRVAFGDARAGSLAATALAGDVVGGVVATWGAVLVDASGAATLGQVTAGGDLAVTAGGATTLAGLEARAATLRGAAVRFGTAAVSSLTATAQSGDVTADAVTAGGPVRIEAADNVVLERLSAGAGLEVTADRSVAFGTLEIGDAATLRAGSIAFGTAQVGSLAATALSGDVTGRELTAGATVLVNAAGGAVTIDQVRTNDGLDVTAGRAVTLTRIGGPGAVTLSGANVAFETADVSSLSVTALAGSVTGSDVAASGRARFTATDRVVLDQVGTGDDLDVDARGVIELGTLEVGRRATLHGEAVRFGTASADSLAMTARGGDVTGGDATTGADLSVDALRGAVTLRNVRADGDLDVTAGGAIELGELNGRGAATIRGASVRFGAADVSSLSATALIGDVAGGVVTAGDSVMVAADGNATLGRLAAGADLDVVAQGEVELASLGVGGTATLRGGSVRFGTAEVGALTATARTGNVTGSDLTAGATVSVSAAKGLVTLGDVGTGSGLDIAAGRAIMLDRLSGRGAATLSGASVQFEAADVSSLGATALSGNVTGGDVTSDDVSIDAAGTATLGRVAATGDTVMVAGETIALASLDAGARATLDAGGDLLAAGGVSATRAVEVLASGDIRAPFIRSAAGDLTVATRAGDVTGFTPGGGIALSAGPGRAFSLRVGGAAVLGDLGGGSVLVAATTLRVGAVDAGTGDVTLRATGGDLAATGLVTGGAVTLEAANRATLGDVAASGPLRLTGGDAGLSFGEASGAVLTAAVSGALTGGAARAAGALTVDGGSVSLGQVMAGAGTTVSARSGDLALGTLASGGDAILSATGVARVTGAVSGGGAYRVSGGGVSFGPAEQRTAGVVQVSAGTGGIAGEAGLLLAGGPAGVVLDSGGEIALAGTQVKSGGGLALRAGAGRAVTFGRVAAAGPLGGFDGMQATAEFTHDSVLVADEVTAAGLAIRLSAGDLRLGRVAGDGAVSLITATGGIAAGSVDAGTLVLASGGAVEAGALTVREAATISGADIATGDVRAGSLGIRTAGGLDGQGGARPALSTTAGDLVVEAGTVRLGLVTSAGAASLTGEAIEVTGRLAAARELLADARAALTLGEASAGGAMTLRSGAAMAVGPLNAGGALSANGAGVTIAAARTGAALTVTSMGAVSLGATAATGAASIDAAGLVTLGALSAGPSAILTAGDAQLNGPVRAAAVTFATKTPATTALRTGDGTAADGFRLSAVELNQVSADRLTLDAGAGALEMGTVALGEATGGTVALLSTGDIRVTGAVSAAGAGRAIRIGGDETEGGMAATIHLLPTSDAGGRLLLADQDIELRGDRIAAGLAPGFLDVLQPGEAGAAQAAELAGNGNSALYNTQFGGGFFAPDAATVLSARSLTVRFGDYALFQNTGVPGTFTGVVLGGTPAAPVAPALGVTATGDPARASFALFGSVNGVSGASAALLGPGVIDIDAGLLATSRINGCLAGSGAGCLTTIVIQPTLQVFDWDSEDVFGISQDVAVPFQPIVGGNNEGLLTGLPELAPATPAPGAPSP